MPDDFFSLSIRWLKMLAARKIIAYVLFVIGTVSLVYVYNQQHNWSLETKNEQQTPDEALVNGTEADQHPSAAPLVNDTWTAIRKVLLNEQNVSKVVILAHARGGSTLCSDVFNIDTNNTVLWYEALHGFHSFYSGVPHYNTDTVFLYYNNLTRRPADSEKQNALAKYLTQLMTCDFENVPVEVISISAFMTKTAVFKDLVDCTERMKTFNRFKDCQEIISKYCFHEELMGASTYPVNDSIVASFKCAELLQSIRRLKSLPQNQVTAKKILRSYFSDTDINRGILQRTLYSDCPQFADLSREAQLTLQRNTKLDQRCLNLESKLSLFIKHDQCLEGLYKDTLACRQKMAAPCHRTRLTAAEFQRVFIEDLEPFIQQMPDIHVVHYVRDPRAVSVSRAEKNIHTFRSRNTWRAMHETYLLCQRMRYDIEHKKRLQQIYPGSIITVRYEDLVLYPFSTVKLMYEFFGRPIPIGVNDWVKRTMAASRDNGMYGVHRSNGKRQLSKWRSYVNVDDLDIMNQHCLDVLKEYDYEL